MMKCVMCKREFDSSDIEDYKRVDRGDGVMYGSVSYVSRPVCPHCGHNNSAAVYIKGGKSYGI